MPCLLLSCPLIFALYTLRTAIRTGTYAVNVQLSVLRLLVGGSPYVTSLQVIASHVRSTTHPLPGKPFLVKRFRLSS